jgi:GNAT superfamily N-acetyltransferase
VSDILNDFSPEALVPAIEANWYEMWASWLHPPHVILHREPDLTWMQSEIPLRIFNGILRAQLSGDRLDPIDSVLAYLRSRRTPLLCWISPSARPVDLGAYLEGCGFRLSQHESGMAVDLASLPEGLPAPAELQIVRVEDREAADQRMKALWRGFGMPECGRSVFFEMDFDLGFGERLPYFRCMGLLHGVPVAAAGLLLSAGVAGIYNVTTVPEARGQGIGAAMTLAALRDARTMGYRVGGLQATRMGLRLYPRLGFRPYCTFSHYVWEPQDAAKT